MSYNNNTPLASNSTFGVVRSGTNINIANGIISSTGGGATVVGTWTPSVSVSTAGTITLLVNTANYSKTGQQITCYFDFTLLTKTGGANANTLTLNGLPFTSISGTGAVGSLVVSIFQNLKLSSSYISGTIAGSSTVVPLYCIHESKDNLRLTYEDVQATTRLVGTVTYISIP